MKIYNAIRRDGKNWWYHKQLRSEGNIIEARKREHSSAKNSIQNIRDVIATKGYFSIGPYGWSLNIGTVHTGTASCKTTVSGYGDGEPYYSACLKYGVPIVDCRDTSLETRLQGIKIPLAAIGIDTPDIAPYSSLSRAPLAYVLDQYETIGYKVIRGNYE